MKTIVMLQVEHDKPIPALANLIAGRAYTISGVKDAEPYTVRPMTYDELHGVGFTPEEIALGTQNVVRG